MTYLLNIHSVLKQCLAVSVTQAILIRNAILLAFRAFRLQVCTTMLGNFLSFIALVFLKSATVSCVFTVFRDRRSIPLIGAVTYCSHCWGHG